MTDDDDTPLRRWFVDPDSDTSPSGGERQEKPPLEVLQEAASLDQGLGEVLVEVMKKGETTPPEIATDLDITLDEAENRLEELSLQGYVRCSRSEDGVFYELDHDWTEEEFPSGPIIPLIYQYNLLSDESRMTALKEAIDETVTEGDVVADLGAGVGILSVLAARKADTVYAVEVDRSVYDRGRNLVAASGVENVRYMNNDARTVDLPGEADVVMCEMLDTALVAELQVPVMNRAMDDILADDGVTIPHRARTSMALATCDYEFFGESFPLLHFEAYGSRSSTVMSDPEPYHEVRFDEHTELFVDETVTLTATEAGTVNTIQLTTDVQFGRDTDFTPGSEWLNAPLNLPLDEEFEVEPGDEITVEISYELAGGFESINHAASRTNS